MGGWESSEIFQLGSTNSIHLVCTFYNINDKTDILSLQIQNKRKCMRRWPKLLSPLLSSTMETRIWWCRKMISTWVWLWRRNRTTMLWIWPHLCRVHHSQRRSPNRCNRLAVKNEHSQNRRRLYDLRESSPPHFLLHQELGAHVCSMWCVMCFLYYYMGF